MNAGNELNLVDAWIFERLASDGPGATYPDTGIPDAPEGGSIQELVGRHPVQKVVQVYCKIVPKGAVAPYIHFAFYKGDDLNGTGGKRIMCKAQYVVQAIAEGTDFGEIGPLTDRIDQLLQQAQDGNDPIIIGIARIRPIQDAKEENGVEKVFQGGIYGLDAYAYGNA